MPGPTAEGHPQCRDEEGDGVRVGSGGLSTRGTRQGFFHVPGPGQRSGRARSQRSRHSIVSRTETPGETLLCFLRSDVCFNRKGDVDPWDVEWDRDRDGGGWRW